MKSKWLLVGVLGWSVFAVAARGQDAPKEADAAATTATKAVKASDLPPFRAGRGGEPVLRMLNKRVASVDWSETTFEDVLDWLKDQGDGQINIIARWAPLGQERVTPETPITLQLRDVRIADVLTELMELLSEDGEVRFHGWDNVLKISTREDFDRTMYVRAYDVSDLLFRVPNFGQSAPQIDLQQTRQSGQGGGSGQSVFSGGSSGGQENEDSGQQAEQRMEQQLERLRDSIRALLAPDAWSPAGRNHIEIVNNTIVVVATIEIHEAIAGYFEYSSQRG